MKIWNETSDILREAMDCLKTGQSCALVVLTKVKGSAFRRPGAKLLVRADGTMTGNVSGGCLEHDLRERALAAMQSGRQEMVHYDTGSDEDIIWGLGLGCDGSLDLLILPLSQQQGRHWITQALEMMSRRVAFSFYWSLTDGPATPPSLNADLSSHSFMDTLDPPPDLFIIGAGDDAIPLAQQAYVAGLRVTVVDHRPGYLKPSRFPHAHAIHLLRPESADQVLNVNDRSLAIIKNHALTMDQDWARFFDVTDAAYIGLLGPKRRCDRLREHMSTGNMDRVYGPAGLDIGGEGAEQIAASIIAEMLSVWNKRKPDHLRHREGPIHVA